MQDPAKSIKKSVLILRRCRLPTTSRCERELQRRHGKFGAEIRQRRPRIRSGTRRGKVGSKDGIGKLSIIWSIRQAPVWHRTCAVVTTILNRIVKRELRKVRGGTGTRRGKRSQGLHVAIDDCRWRYENSLSAEAWVEATNVYLTLVRSIFYVTPHAEIRFALSNGHPSPTSSWRTAFNTIVPAAVLEPILKANEKLVPSPSGFVAKGSYQYRC